MIRQYITLRRMSAMALALMLAVSGATLHAECPGVDATAPAAESFYIEGEGGVPLAVTVSGPKGAPAMLFLHGFGLGAASFAPQFDSDLAKSFRLVAFDLRGHGMSGKPFAEADYIQTATWAADVRRVIAATSIDRPVIVAWSYGTLVAADYIRHEGVEGISGLVLTGGVGGLVAWQLPASTVNDAASTAWVRLRELRAIPSLKAQEEAVALATPMLTHGATAYGWVKKAKLLGVMVPAYLQGPLRKHRSANTDLIARLSTTPALLAYGEHDLSVPPQTVAALRKALPSIAIRKFNGAGHAPFAEQPAAFNALLADFVCHLAATKPSPSSCAAP